MKKMIEQLGLTERATLDALNKIKAVTVAKYFGN